ncbi:UNVERIFIED_CONTAM: hypothetical protein RMT77_009780 [Armadillidium vulgare]
MFRSFVETAVVQARFIIFRYESKRFYSSRRIVKMSLLPRLVSTSVAIADHAGKLIRDIMSKGDLGIVTKEHAKDLQTKADRNAQKCIIGSLLNHFPKIKIIGEEEEEGTSDNLVDPSSIKVLDIKCPPEYENLKEEEVVVWVDPLDGTAEYTEGLLDHVTVLIGIATGGKAIGGIIHQPYYNYQNPGSPLGRTIWSTAGGNFGGITLQSPPSDSFIVTTTRSHSSSTVNDAVASVNPTQVLRVGGAGHKVLLLIEGKAHAYVFASPGCKKWDTCAPQAVLEAVGGTLADISGVPIPYDADAPHRNSTGVLAVASGVNFTEVLNKIPEHVKNNLKA